MALKKAAAAVTLFVLFATIGPAAQQPPAFNRYEVLSVLEGYLEALRQQAGIPGMSAAIVRGGTVLWERGFGFADATARIRATPDTPYLVGDLSGTIAAVLVLQCVEQRRLELDQPVRRYGITGAEGDVTLRQILSHTSTEAPGGAFAYNPDRFALTAPLMEQCAPQPYRKSVAHRVLNRLAMIDSVPGTDLANPDLELPEDLFDAADLDRYRRVLQRIAVPYRVDNRGRAERTILQPMGISATNGLVTTVRDLARFEGAIVPVPDSEVASSLLLQTTLDVAWNPASTRAGHAAPMGLGWFMQYHRGQKVVWHFGNVPNAYSSLLVRVPAYDLTFILLANSDRLSSPFQLHQGDVNKSLFATLFLRLFT
jgi:CubicO group peptidase (beta-lactamase class C family)